MKTGIVISFNPTKSCGFIQSRNLEDPTRWVKYFFHANKIVVCSRDLDKIGPGMFAKFRVSEKPPLHSGQCEYALDIELYEMNPDAVATAALDAISKFGGGQ